MTTLVQVHPDHPRADSRGEVKQTSPFQLCRKLYFRYLNFFSPLPQKNNHSCESIPLVFIRNELR